MMKRGATLFLRRRAGTAFVPPLLPPVSSSLYVTAPVVQQQQQHSSCTTAAPTTTPFRLHRVLCATTTTAPAPAGTAFHSAVLSVGHTRGMSHQSPILLPNSPVPIQFRSRSSSDALPQRRYYAGVTVGGSGGSGQAPKAFTREKGEVAPPMSTATMLPPDAVVLNLIAKGVYMANLSTFRMLVGGWLAGIFLSFGCSLMIQVAGIPFATQGLHLFLGALVFPVGLTLITWHGADLLTGCFMYCFMPFLNGAMPREKAIRGLVRCWTMVGLANLVACVLMALVGGQLTNPLCAQFAGALAVKKTSLGFMTCFAKAVGANFLVCTAMAGAMSAQTPGGKLVAIWLPISTFVAMGLEHSIANMFLIPLGMHFSNVTLYDFIVGNQIPAILGNIVGAWVFGATMWFRHRRR